MHAPVKRIQNKFRYQVLMRLTDASVLKSIYNAVSAVKRKDVLIYVEENPANLS
jgi:primosomal protein N'